MTSKENESQTESALHVKKGIASSHDGRDGTHRRRFVKKKRAFSVDSLSKNIIDGSRLDLAQGITLIESMKQEDKVYAQDLLQKMLPHSGKSIRIGVSGVPGAGKSTFIETFGLMLCNQGY